MVQYGYWSGADIAFDERNLTGYFASRPYTYSTSLIANKLASVPAAFKSLFAPAVAVPQAA